MGSHAISVVSGRKQHQIAAGGAAAARQNVHDGVFGGCAIGCAIVGSAVLALTEPRVPIFLLGLSGGGEQAMQHSAALSSPRHSAASLAQRCFRFCVYALVVLRCASDQYDDVLHNDAALLTGETGRCRRQPSRAFHPCAAQCENC